MGEPHCNYKTRTVALGVLCLVFLIAVIVLAVMLSEHSPAEWGPCCPEDWVWYQGKCYYFSESEGNWTYSRSRCSALGASLAGIDTRQEMRFMLRYKGELHHWIGLWRDPEQCWKWTNGTEFNRLFGIRGDGNCAYLNDENGVSSSRCSGELPWICSKPDTFTAAKETPAG
ncbi:C-type lectin domain family 2 member D3-like isoform X2 [Pelodiscus sinensis]|uniref:C-type lectin domain family 2 member D3-like isoform X2 n=1 Tax=Pelodiscus sinensis TaxID=13735 RepID=UPI003F6C1A12